MADVDGVVHVQTPFAQANAETQPVDGHVAASFVLITTFIEFFKMRGRDQTCPAGQQPAYVYWTVQDVADPTAAFAMASDLICGSDPLTDIVEIEVAMRWREF